MGSQNDRLPRKLAGILATVAAACGLLITPVFAAAFFQAYQPGDLPAWLSTVVRAFPGLLDFTSDERVYQVYGRIYSFVIPLTLAALLILNVEPNPPSRLARWGWRIFFAGTVMGGLGIIGDYWPDPNSFLIGIGFLIDLIGTLVMWAGAILLGAAIVRRRHLPRWIGFALIGIVPGGILGFAILGHIPSGPWLGSVIFCLAMGVRLLQSELRAAA
jgi:hypothetical protein